jgi:16S rRNA (guanine(527)-N(7))-methyltransferase RsmG
MQNKKTENLLSKIDAILSFFYADEDLCRRSKLLNDYVSFLEIWLRTHNVVSRKNAVDEIWLNVYDSLAILESNFSSILSDCESIKNIVDAGAGGGFPGIPLAIVLPNRNFLLIDSNRKKCSFLRSVKAKLNLKNVVVLQSKIENIERPDVIITKAAFSPPHIGLVANPLAPEGDLVLWASENTRNDFVAALEIHRVSLLDEYDYEVPDHAKRCLLHFRKIG